jgi:regulator of RNase E activity RraA
MNAWRTIAIAVVTVLAFLSANGRCQAAAAKKQKAESAADLSTGKNFIPTKTYSEEEDAKLLELFKGLRVSDVCDGMDAVGLQNIGLMEPEIRPLWRDTVHYTHRIVGIAVTARYVPTQKPPAGKMSIPEYDKWVKETYAKVTPEPFVPLIRKGTVMVIEEAPNADVGTIGSNNIMGWVSRGCVGVVSSTTARDSDEIITEKVPLYYKRAGRGIRPGRNEIESVNRPIVCGGALVMPGDVIVADGDGVIVVPRAVTEDVAKYAKGILEGDKTGRRGLYKKLGLPEDDSVK